MKNNEPTIFGLAGELPSSITTEREFRKSDDNDPLFTALVKLYREKEEAKRGTLSPFDSLGEVLTHLANSSPKEREKFLKPWKDESARLGIGRKKNNDFAYYCEMHDNRRLLEIKNDKKFSSWKKFLESYFKERYPGMSVDDADKKIKTACNTISGWESKMRKLRS